MSSKWARRRDTNEKEIDEALAALGALVIDTAGVGQIIPGYPDRDVAFRGRWVKVEIKSGVKASFTEPELNFIRGFARRAPIIVVTNRHEAIRKLIQAVNEFPRWQDPVVKRILDEEHSGKPIESV